MTAKTKPWFFRPVLIGLYFGVGYVVSMLFAIAGSQSQNAGLVFVYIFYLTTFFYYPIVTYQYLSFSAVPGSRHSPRRNRFIFAGFSVLFGFAFFIAPAFFKDALSVEQNTFDLLAIPIIVLYLIIVWRTGGLISELSHGKSSNASSPIGWVFAFFFLPFTAAFIAERVNRLAHR